MSSTRVSNTLLGQIHNTLYYQNWSLIISALSLLASVIYFYNALAVMKANSEASLLNDVLSEYSSPQMLDRCVCFAAAHASEEEKGGGARGR